MSFLSKLFGSNKALEEALANNPLIVDVREPSEYKQGHVNGSLNIPLGKLPERINKLEAVKQPIVLCCASGMRSGRALQLVKSKGITNAYNGGGWRKVKSMLP